MYDLSILIPARHEQFLSRTVEDILLHLEGNTEIIVILDGALADPPIPQHPRVTVVYHPVSVGQRAAGNEAAKLASGKYVMKVDAHCSFDQGFDRKMLEAFAEVGDDVTMVPVMKNLHAFSWRCPGCKKETYQGPRPEGCDQCDVTGDHFEQAIKWIAKQSPNSTSYCFTPDLRFKYFGEWKGNQEGDLAETMSLQGSCFMLTKERYFALGICDESWGNWGQQGSEVALKTWLSGGRVLCNKRTWYAHLFRTQKGFSFPWGGDAKSQHNAIRKCQDTFLQNKWPMQKRPLSWLVEKFWPVPGWSEEDLAKLKPLRKAGVVYYTDNSLEPTTLARCQEQLRKSFSGEIVSVSLQPLSFGKNIVLPEQRGILTMFKQILAGLEASTADYVFFCEHDVLYHPSHFTFRPPRNDTYYYNMHSWIVRASDGHAVYYDHKSLSGLCADRELLIRHYKERIRRVEQEGFTRRMGFEPGTHNRAERVDDIKAEGWISEGPNLDLKHGKNLTQARWHPSDFRDQRNCRNWTETDSVPGWDISFPL